MLRRGPAVAVPEQLSGDQTSARRFCSRSIRPGSSSRSSSRPRARSARRRPAERHRVPADVRRFARARSRPTGTARASPTRAICGRRVARPSLADGAADQPATWHVLAATSAPCSSTATHRSPPARAVGPVRRAATASIDDLPVPSPGAPGRSCSTPWVGPPVGAAPVGSAICASTASTRHVTDAPVRSVRPSALRQHVLRALLPARHRPQQVGEPVEVGHHERALSDRARPRRGARPGARRCGPGRGRRPRGSPPAR